jgi:hypothetical protein
MGNSYSLVQGQSLDTCVCVSMYSALDGMTDELERSWKEGAMD